VFEIFFEEFLAIIYKMITVGWQWHWKCIDITR